MASKNLYMCGQSHKLLKPFEKNVCAVWADLVYLHTHT